MGGFINGPVIKMSVDEGSLTASIQEALGKISAQAVAENKKISQGISAAIVNPLVAQAAQLRALYSTGSIGIKDLQTQQKALISLLDVQITKLATRNDLDRQSLATLKQLTLERERQQNAVNRGVGVGVTAGTQSALSSVSGPIIGNISRLGTGLLGVAGGSGGGGAAFAGAAAGITAITAAGGPAIAVLGGLAAALVVAGGAAVGLATSGASVVLRLSNISQQTGISIQNLQVLEAAGKTVGVSLDDLVTGFRKFSQAVSGGNGGIDDGITGSTKKASDILKILGVTSKDSFTALQQFADGISKLPDGLLKDATVVDTLGRSALNLLPQLNKGAAGVEQFRAIVAQFGPSIDQNAIQSTQNWQLATEKLSLAFDSLKVSAVPLLSVLSSITTEAAQFLKAMNGDTSSFSTLEKVGLFLSTAGLGTAISLGNSTGNSARESLSSSGILGGATALLTTFVPAAKSLADQLNNTGGAAASFGAAMDSAFTVGENGAKKLAPNVKALTDLLNGTTDALNKLKEEGAKELQALTDEAGKSAVGKLGAFTLTGAISDPNATASDNILTKQREDLEAIAQIMLNFPNLANQVQAAVAGVTAKTIKDLQKLADEATAKETLQEAADLGTRIENEKKLNQLISGVDDELAVERAKAAKDAVTEIIKAEQKRLDDQLEKSTLLGASEQQLQDLRVKAVQDAQLKIAKLRQDEVDKTTKQIEGQAGSLFDALLKGGSNFTTAVKTSLENLLLAPVKSVFSAVVGGLLTGPVQGGKDLITSFGRQLQNDNKDNPTGILSSIGRGLAPPSAIGNNTDALGSNTKALLDLTSRLGGGTGVGGSGGGSSLGGLLGAGGGSFNPLTDALPLGDVGTQIGNLSGGVESLPLPLGNVSQELANLSGVLDGTNTSASTSPNALGTIFSNLTKVLTGTSPGTSPGSGVGLFGGGTGLILHGFGGASSSGTAGVTSALSSPLLGLLGGATNLIAGITGKSPAQAAGGLATLGGGALSQLGKAQGNSGLSQAGGIIGGAGLVVSGIAQGSIGGDISSALGGAEIGTAIAPGIGTAIGAAAGFVAGIIGGLFHHPGFTPAQISAAIKRQTVDPNLFVGQEFDRSAQGNFGATLNSTFSEGTGGQFSSSSINGPRQSPVVNFNIQAMDSKGVADFFAQHGSTVAKVVAGKINSTQSGLARQIRTAVQPA
jgi:hypothetical protein